MSFLSRLFFSTPSTPPENIAPAAASSPLPGHELLVRLREKRCDRAAELFFLDLCEQKVLDSQRRSRWSEYLHSVDAEVGRLIALGLLRTASIEQKVMSRLGAREIKEELRKLGQKSTGRKPELASRLAEAISPEGAEQLLGGTAVYEPTAAGSAHVNELARESAKDSEAVESILRAFLEAGDPVGACDFAWQAREQRTPRRLDGEESTLRSPSGPVVEAMRLHLADLETTEAVERQARIALALSILLLEDDRKAGGRIEDAVGGSFRCAALDRWQVELEEKGLSALRGRLPDAALYAETKRREAENAAWLRQAIEERLGIRIVSCQDCPDCRSRKVSYDHRELDKAPRLPRHWGCGCTFLPS